MECRLKSLSVKKKSKKMNEYRFKWLILIFILFLIFPVTLFGIDFDFTGKWNVYSFSKRWITTEESFIKTIGSLDCLFEDEQWEFSFDNSYKSESLENTSNYSGSWEIVPFENIIKSSILFISENEFYIITKHSEGSTPFGLISFKKFIRFHQTRNAELVSIPIRSFIGIPEPIRDRHYTSSNYNSDNNNSDQNISSMDYTRIPESAQFTNDFYNSDNNNSDQNISSMDYTSTPESAQFINDFYNSVNDYRESRGLGRLRRDSRVEKVAVEYSTILAKNGHIDHYALSESEFNTLCQKHGLETVTLNEIILRSYDDTTASEAKNHFRNSPPTMQLYFLLMQNLLVLDLLSKGEQSI